MAVYRKINFDELCRLCMCVSGKRHNLFNSSDGHDGQLMSKLKKCIPLQFKEDDSLPKGICDNCVAKIERYHDFINQCAIKDSLLKRYYVNFGVSSQSKHTKMDNQEDNKINMNPLAHVIPITIEPDISHFEFNISESNVQDSNTDNSKSTVSDDIKMNMNNSHNVNNSVTTDGSFARRKVLKCKKEVMTHNKCEVLKKYKKGLQNSRQRISKKNMLPTFICDNCKKIFKKKEHLVQHLKCHHVKQPYSCEICQKSYVHKEHLNKHKLSHESQRI